jgi:hypothetical protein
MTDHGPVLMLPPEYIDAINEHESLSFTEYTYRNFLASYDTFRTYRPPPPNMFNEAVIKGLTRSLRTYPPTPPLHSTN